jgi:hypothetical protein
MFFLGGINSVVPYILYLSVIWLFLMVSFRGKIHEVWHKISPAKEASQEYFRTGANQEIFHYFDSPAGHHQKQSSSGQMLLSGPSLTRCFINEDIIQPKAVDLYKNCLYAAIGLRGPPGGIS